MGNALAGKAAIVTGAANGIGRAVARRFVAEGASVTMADHDEDKLESAVAELNEADLDGRAQVFSGDLTEKLCMTNLVAATIDAFETIDILVNAHRMMYAAAPLESDGDRFQAILAQNVVANYRMSRIVAKRMVELGDAESELEAPRDRAIVNVSSIQGRRAVPELLAYSVSCAALDQLTRSLAGTLAPRRIRVNAIAVGGIMGQSIEQALGRIEDMPSALAEVVPLGRLGDASEAAEAALFLASPAASFITGQILTVDGGRMLLDPLGGREA